jgi:hypothetical protein
VYFKIDLLWVFLNFSWTSVFQTSKFWLRWFALGLKCEWKKVFLINPKIVDTDFHKGKIKLNDSFPKTEVDDIFYIVKNIINSKEMRFEIDV